MEIAEQSHKKPEDMKDDEDLNDPDNKHSGTYNSTGQLIRTILIDKLEEDTEGFLIIKRNDDYLSGYAELLRHMIELTTAGLHDKMAAVMRPAQAKRCVQLKPSGAKT